MLPTLFYGSELTWAFCLSFFWGGNLLITFMSYSLFRNMFLMVFLYPLLRLLLDTCVTILISSNARYLMFVWMAGVFWYYDVRVGFRYIEYCKFMSFQCILVSRKLMDSSCSFSIVNFMVCCSLLNALSVWSMFVLFWSYIINISSTYLKYAIIHCCISMGYICVCSICCMYVSASIDDDGAPMASPSVYNTLGQTEVVLLYYCF
jgi:hypothetical protein